MQIRIINISILLAILIFNSCGNYSPLMDIHDAARSGSIIAIRQALLAGDDINKTNNEGQTALLTALYGNHVEAAKFLIESGADVNKGHGSPLSLALYNNNLELFQILLEKGAYVDDELLDELTYNYSRLQINETELIKEIIKHGKTKDGNRQTLLNKTLNYAAFRGDRYLIDLLIKEGAEVYPGLMTDDELAKLPEAERVLSEPDKRGLETPLNQAARSGNLEMVKEFYEKGSPLDGALYFALWEGHGEVIQYALQNGLDLNEEKKYYPMFPYTFFNHEPPTQQNLINILIGHGLMEEKNIDLAYELLRRSAERGSKDVIAMLLDQGLDIMHNHELPDHNLLMRSQWSNNIDTVKYLVEKSGGQLIQSPGAQGILVNSVIGNHMEIFEYLLEQGANIHLTNLNGENVIHAAVQMDDTDILQLALENEVNINGKTNDGITPLMSAVLKGNLNMTKLLLENGADTQLKDLSSKTALDYAREYEDQEMIELLTAEN